MKHFDKNDIKHIGRNDRKYFAINGIKDVGRTI